MIRKSALTYFALIVFVTSLLGCSAPLTTREKGAGIGALGGAAAGGIIGSTVGHAGAGAAIGGLLGLGAGALIGDQLQGQEMKQDEPQASQDLQSAAENMQNREIPGTMDRAAQMMTQGNKNGARSQRSVNRSRSVLRHRAVVEKYAPKGLPDAPSAETGAIVELERSEVVKALSALPTRQREALVLRYYGDLSEAEIANAMGISRGAVKSHTARGMAALAYRKDQFRRCSSCIQPQV